MSNVNTNNTSIDFPQIENILNNTNKLHRILLVSSGDSTGDPKFMPRPAYLLSDSIVETEYSKYAYCIFMYKGKISVGLVTKALEADEEFKERYLEGNTTIQIYDTTNVRYANEGYANLGWKDDSVKKAKELLIHLMETI